MQNPLLNGCGMILDPSRIRTLRACYWFFICLLFKFGAGFVRGSFAAVAAPPTPPEPLPFPLPPCPSPLPHPGSTRIPGPLRSAIGPGPCARRSRGHGQLPLSLGSAWQRSSEAQTVVFGLQADFPAIKGYFGGAGRTQTLQS